MVAIACLGCVNLHCWSFPTTQYSSNGAFPPHFCVQHTQCKMFVEWAATQYTDHSSQFSVTLFPLCSTLQPKCSFYLPKALSVAPECPTNEFSKSSCYNHPVDYYGRHRIIQMENLFGVGAQLGTQALVGSGQHCGTCCAQGLCPVLFSCSCEPALLQTWLQDF